MRFHTAVNKFCWQAVMGQPITVWRMALNQKRPYLGLADAVRALSHILRVDLFDNQVYNVLTINATVSEIVGSIRGYIPDLQVEYVDSKIMNQLSYTVLAEKFAATGFRPEDSLDQGIAATVALLDGIRNPQVAALR
jgi:nucleoside-diphosphate-sugar epimerase